MKRWSRWFADSVLRKGDLERVRIKLDQEEELLVLLPKFQEREPIREVSG